VRASSNIWLGLAVAVIVCAATARHAAAIEPIVLSEGVERVAIAERLWFLEDRDGSLTFEEVSSPALADRYLVGRLNHGFSSSVYWFHFAVESRRDGPEEWLLEVGYPLLDDLVLHVQQPDGSYEVRVAGDLLPFAQRELVHRNFVFRLRIAPGQVQRFYLRVASHSSVQVPMVLSTPVAFASADHPRQFAIGLFYGSLLAIVLYNAFMFFAVREQSYLLFCLYAMSYALIQGGMDGLSYQYLWPAWPGFNAVSLPLTLSMTIFFATWFSHDFLRLRETLPRWSRIQRGVMGLGGMLVVLAVLAPYAVSVRVGAALAAITVIILGVVGIVALRAGYRSARYYVLAWSVFLLGTLTLVLGKFGLLPLMVATTHGPHIGAVIQLVVLSFALSDRVHLMKREKQQAQREALEMQQRLTQTLQAEVDEQTRELREQRDALARTQRQKDELTQCIVHDLKNPLTIVAGNVELVLDDPELSEDARDSLTAVRAGSDAMLRMVINLLDISRSEDGALEPRVDDVDTRALFRELETRMACWLQRHGHALEARVELATIRADRDLLLRILENLIENASKYTPAGCAIRVEAAVEEGAAVLRVRDEGPGIPEQERENVFRKYHRLERNQHADTRTSRGLGLVFCRLAAEAHGGAIWVEDNQPRGCCFCVRLPGAAVDERPNGTAPRSAELTS
jgi:two-component system, sensor histidine kinase LadS